MDSQHRHDLKENDLEQFLLHFKDFWNKHGMTVLVAILVVVVAVTGFRYFRNQSLQAHENAWAELAGATSPEALRNVGLATDNATVRAQAFLRAGTLELQQAVTVASRTFSPDAEQPVPLTPQQRTEALERAQADFKRVLEQQSVPPIYHVNATIGLANVAESRRNWDDARDQWQKVKDLAGQYEAMAAHAEHRLAYLPRLDHPVYFAPEPIKKDFELPPIDLTRPQDDPDKPRPSPAGDPNAPQPSDNPAPPPADPNPADPAPPTPDDATNPDDAKKDDGAEPAPAPASDNPQ